MSRKERNITRMDYARTHGWWVRIYRTQRGEKVCTSRHFSDSVHGGKRKALAAAVKWRNRTLRKLPHPLKLERGYVKRPYGYVKRVFLMRRAEYHEVWLAWARLKSGRAVSTSASIEVWGAREARRRAEQWLLTKTG